ncbi:EAL domain-containing protein [Azoarcus indigens]|uniref:histidine kinase n=1 Tax=Azoarcus indigens TaxID=29545 RepID=A0A4R6DUM6_9RHOO|nr:EAL domain-containing protein [Azoarcus indigens]TDN48414.1 light-regulated signal transduction histidine kinase (bacteriophytochrome) [Azoarcus indigens]
MAPGLLGVEIIESRVMDDAECALRVGNALREDGISLYVDDFGTGYFSPSYPQKLPVDYIKIDQSFIAALPRDRDSAVIVRSTIDLVHDLGCKAMAEGVETLGHWQLLAGLGCDMAQGYFIARPMPVEAFPAWARGFGLVPLLVSRVCAVCSPRARACCILKRPRARAARGRVAQWAPPAPLAPLPMNPAAHGPRRSIDDPNEAAIAINEAGMADCSREPIHIPGGIQPHGFLLSVDEAGRVVQASENLAALAGAPVEALLGEPLERVLGAEAAGLAVRALRGLEADGAPVHAGTIADPRDTAGGPGAASSSGTAHAPLALLVHRYEGAAIVELEPARATADVFASLYPLVRAFIHSLQGAETVECLARLAAGEVHRVAGFGRTLVYRFDEDGAGHVLAEEIEAGYHSYIDQHFPGSDIPAQARALYVRNRIRLIADADYQPARLVPPLHPHTGRPTDLSYASLRSVSPVHVQYMKNMGTWASMSMSIVVRGRLWGLISCHNARPMLPTFEVRSACEHIAQLLSLQIEAKEDHAEATYRLQLRERQARLLAALADTDDFVDGLARQEQELMALTGASGAAVVFEGRIERMGAAPGLEVIGKLVAWLDSHTEDVFATDHLAGHWPPAGAGAEGAVPDEGCAGILAVSISRLFRNYVIWFRAETVRTIKWAGDPRAKLQGQPASLSPRASFEMWTQTVRGRSLPWRGAEIEIVQAFRAALLGIVLRRAEEMAQLALDLGRVNRELEEFSYTVSHDLRAPLRHIAAFTDLLREREAHRLSERGRDFLERILTQARFGGRLVDDLLGFSRMSRTALRVQRVDMDRLVARLATEETRGIERRIEWRVGELGQISADPLLIEVAMRNLIANAVKFTANRGGGNGGEGQPPARIEIGRSAGEGELAGQDVFHVGDNGVGFDMRYVDKLFGVFQRLHHEEEFPGTGIGLASVRRIVERHGGRAWARGEPGRGATMYFSLPNIHRAEADAHNPSLDEAAARLAALSSAQSYKPVLKDTSKDGNQ